MCSFDLFSFIVGVATNVVSVPITIPLTNLIQKPQREKEKTKEIIRMKVENYKKEIAYWLSWFPTPTQDIQQIDLENTRANRSGILRTVFHCGNLLSKDYSSILRNLDWEKTDDLEWFKAVKRVLEIINMSLAKEL